LFSDFAPGSPPPSTKRPNFPRSRGIDELVLFVKQQGGKTMPQETWSYKWFQIDEGLKPGSRSFRYFFYVSESDRKKCNYCIWIEDDALGRFDPSEDFESIVSSRRDQWQQWVKEKIDANDFRNVVLKCDTKGESEVDLEKMDKKLTMD
jgi:hypothetical protein